MVVSLPPALPDEHGCWEPDFRGEVQESDDGGDLCKPISDIEHCNRPTELLMCRMQRILERKHSRIRQIDPVFSFFCPTHI